MCIHIVSCRSAACYFICIVHLSSSIDYKWILYQIMFNILSSYIEKILLKSNRHHYQHL